MHGLCSDICNLKLACIDYIFKKMQKYHSCASGMCHLEITFWRSHKIYLYGCSYVGTYVDCYNLTLHKTYLCIPCCSEQKMDVGSYAGIDLNNPPLVDLVVCKALTQQMRMLHPMLK